MALYRFALFAVGALVWATAAQSAVTLYSSSATFTGAAGQPTNKATFESFSDGVQGQTLLDDGIFFTSLPGGHPKHDVYTTRPGNLTNPTQNPSFSLSGDGDENFRIQLNNGSTFGSIGFDFISNRYGDPTITLFGVGGASLGTFKITSAKNTLVFFGVISDTPIARAETTVDRGYIEDTAYDNVALGPVQALSAVPEPATWGMMLGGFGLVGGSLRARRRSAAGRAVMQVAR